MTSKQTTKAHKTQHNGLQNFPVLFIQKKKNKKKTNRRVTLSEEFLFFNTYFLATSFSTFSARTVCVCRSISEINFPSGSMFVDKRRDVTTHFATFSSAFLNCNHLQITSKVQIVHCKLVHLNLSKTKFCWIEVIKNVITSKTANRWLNFSRFLLTVLIQSWKILVVDC